MAIALTTRVVGTVNLWSSSKPGAVVEDKAMVLVKSPEWFTETRRLNGKSNNHPCGCHGKSVGPPVNLEQLGREGN